MPKLDMARLTHENASLGATFVTRLSGSNLSGTTIVDDNVVHEPDDFFTFSMRATVGIQQRFLSGSFSYGSLDDSANAEDSIFFVFPGTNVEVGFLKNPDGRVIVDFGAGVSGRGFRSFIASEAQATAISVVADTGNGFGLQVLGHQETNGQITSINWGPPPGNGRGFEPGDVIRIRQGYGVFGDAALTATYTLVNNDVNVGNGGNLDNLSGLTLAPENAATMYLHRARPIYDS